MPAGGGEAIEPLNAENADVATGAEADEATPAVAVGRAVTAVMAMQTQPPKRQPRTIMANPAQPGAHLCEACGCGG